MIGGRLLSIALVVTGICCVTLVALIVIAKIHRRRVGAKSRKLLSTYRHALIAIASDEDDDGQAKAVLDAVPGPIWRRLRPRVVAFLPKVRGAAADDLGELLRSRGEIDRATKMLTSRSGVRRARGAYLLGLVRDPNLAVLLIPLLEDREPDVRLVSARALGEIGESSAANGILRALRTSRGRIGLPDWVAVEALLAMGAEIAPALESGLTSNVAAVRNVCAQVAGHGTFFSTASQLCTLLDTDSDGAVRNSAAMALARVGDATAVAVLARNTSSVESAKLRRTCATALGDLGRSEGLNTLVELLGDRDRRLAQIAADSMVRIGIDGVIKLEEVAVGDDPSAQVGRGALELAGLRGQLVNGSEEV